MKPMKQSMVVLALLALTPFVFADMMTGPELTVIPLAAILLIGGILAVIIYGAIKLIRKIRSTPPKASEPNGPAPK